MAKSKADESLERSKARAQMRQDLIEASSGGAVKISRERGRQRRSVERTKTVERLKERQGSEAARVEGYRQRSEIVMQQRAAARVQRVQTQADLNALARREKFTQAAISAPVNAVTRSSVWSTITLIATLFFIMIFLYVIVTNGERFGAFTGSIGKFISGLSSTTPLFVNTESQ